MAITAVLAASFALREGREPNPCNIALAREAIRICIKLRSQGHKFVLVAQWEIALAIRQLGYGHYIYEEIGLYADGRYLGTKELVDQAVPFFEEKGCVQFVAVANPFLHLFMVRQLGGKYFEVLKEKIHWIGFDRESDQWWCRSWWQLVIYTGMAVFGLHGFGGKQAKA